MKIVSSLLKSCSAPIFGLSCLLASGCASAEESGKWTLKRSSENWRITGDLKAPANISGIASLDGQRFLLGSDDLMIAQLGTIDREEKILNVTRDVALLGSKADDEIDIEAIAADPGNGDYYVTGSHSLTKKGNMNKERRSILRVGVSKSGAIKNKVKDASLRDIINSDSTLRPFWEQPQQVGGINIEGLAWKDGALYAGLRSPNIDDHAMVVKVSARALFQKGKVSHQLLRVPLGDGLGIRELVSIAEGFLVVAGNAGDEPTRAHPVPRDYRKNRGYELFFWDGAAAVRSLGKLPKFPGRPEAILVLSDSSVETQMLILWDGISGGAPSHFVLKKG